MTTPLTTDKQPVVGMRVRRVTPHRSIVVGTLGTIDVVSREVPSDFWVVTDDGAFCGWTSFTSWEPVL